MSTGSDFLVIGAGIVGLSIARELKTRYPGATLTVVEKESRPGRHSSGRNSGVLHSGIYYPADSLKARVCKQGAIELAEFHRENGLPISTRGKLLVTTRPEDVAQFDLLVERAQTHDIPAEVLDEQDLRDLEPQVRSATGKALWIPSTAVGSPGAVMETLTSAIEGSGVKLKCGTEIAGVDATKKRLTMRDGSRISYGHVINSAGLYADSVAHLFGVGRRYTLLPFKGIYWKLDPKAGIAINRLIYPVPDLRVPFLGVHTTTTVDGQTYLGPTAVPAFGRENYRGLEGVGIGELMRILRLLSTQFLGGRDGFRRLAWQEGRRYFKPWFLQAARVLLPGLKGEHLLPSDKVGIRAQMLDRETGRLVTDFLVEQGPDSTHVLNAISPAWTSAFPFARHVCDEYIERS